MIIKNFSKPAHSIDDIENIPERRRFVIVYKYPDGPHKSMFEIYSNEIYDLYVINTSTLVGKNYIIPKDIVLQHKNTYRGKVINPFNPDGSFNFSSRCIFNTSSFATRIVKERDVLKITKKDVLGNGTYEDYIANMLKCDTITPFPTYYNVEDQARLAPKNIQRADFDIFIPNNPEYTLDDFRDRKSAYISLEIHEDNLFNNQNMLEKMLFGGNLFNQENQSLIVDIIKDHFIAAFLDCYEIILRSIFAQAYVIMDLDSGLFSVDKNTLTLKHSYHVTSEEVKKEYGIICLEIEDLMSSFDMLQTDYINDSYYDYGNVPSRIMIYISPVRCRIKLSYDNEKILKRRAYNNSLTEYSSSDTEESVYARESGESMFPDYSYYDEP